MSEPQPLNFTQGHVTETLGTLPATPLPGLFSSLLGMWTGGVEVDFVQKQGPRTKTATYTFTGTKSTYGYKAVVELYVSRGEPNERYSNATEMVVVSLKASFDDQDLEFWERYYLVPEDGWLMEREDYEDVNVPAGSLPATMKYPKEPKSVATTMLVAVVMSRYLAYLTLDAEVQILRPAWMNTEN